METVRPSLSALFSRSRRQHRKGEAQTAYAKAHQAWESVTSVKSRQYQQALLDYEAALASWQTRKSAFETAQASANSRIDAIRAAYGEKRPEGVIPTCNLALLALDRPAGFPCFWQISMANGGLAVDYDLPAIEQIAWLKSVGYVRPRDAFEPVELSSIERSQVYRDALFQTCLAALHVLFRTDTAEIVQTIIFHGWRNGIDRFGAPERCRIMVLEVSRPMFGRVNLAALDAETCFRALNGTTSLGFDKA